MEATVVKEEIAKPAQQQKVSKDDLLSLVKAIKFAHPEKSVRDTHREITLKLSQNESFEFLKDITLNDVKKVWKKAVQSNSGNTAAAAQKTGIPSNVAQKDVWKLYTIGDGSVATLAQDYSRNAAKAAAEEAKRQEQDKQEHQEYIMNNFVHVFLDVPANRSGSKPHQALINFHDNTVLATTSTKTGNDNQEDHEIVKIQLAAAPEGQKYPMLLYNKSRSAKTFIHPDADDDGYDKIRDLILQSGVGGAAGAQGGIKSYFYCHQTKRKTGPDVMSIDITRLAPQQTW